MEVSRKFNLGTLFQPSHIGDLMKNKTSRSKKGNLRENVKLSLPSDYGWKVLDRMIQDLSHLFTESEKSRLFAVVRSRNYDDYLALSEDWGPQSKYLDGKSLAQARGIYQVTSLIKKFRFPSDNAMRRAAAIEKFIDAEASCKEYNLNGFLQLACTEDDRMCNVFTYACSFLTKLLGDDLPSDDKLTHWSRHGPGANLDTKRGRNNTYFKYCDWPYSCTQGALWQARIAIESDERWKGALEDSVRERNDIPKHAILDQNEFYSTVLNVVPGNRIAFVPKNSRTDRSIAIEPSMNLYLQLGIDGFIRRRLKRWGVDLDSQEKNRELARLGSRDWEDPENFVTLDLAAASDSISVELCKLVLPKRWYNHLMLLRSPVGELDGEVISYEKISSMGNGFTFALETAIFTSIVYGVMREFDGGFDPEFCAVYGDDIIVRSNIASQVVTALNLCGFTINEDKSFLEGPFRESCGADWFKGKPVRPVFLTSSPSSVMELWTDINRLRRILSLRFCEEESNVEHLLDQWIPELYRKFLGPCSDEQFDSYKHTAMPQQAYRYGLYKYNSLVAIPDPVQGRSFLFRKLMHTLRDGPPPKVLYQTSHDKWKGLRLESVGGRFSITKPGSVMLRLKHSAASHWQSEYREHMPAYPDSRV